MLLAVLQAESTLHRKIALHLPRSATLESKTRTVARVFHDAQLTPQDVTDVLLPLLPDGKLTLIMDRTTWHYGQTPLNILVLGVLLGGAVIPLVWSILPHQGNSCTAARILLVARLLKVMPARRWAVLIADREFVGREWCSFLRWKRIRQCIRIRENTRIEDELVRDLFTTLQPGQVRTLFERTWVYGGWMHVVITLSPAGDRVIVASDLPVLDVFNTYRLRWGIESTFSSLKSRGLNLESTHMTSPERISRLFGLLCIAFAWMTRVGAHQIDTHAPRRDNRGRAVVSQTRIGWQILSQAARWGGEVFCDCLRLLGMPFPAASTSFSRSVRC
ncbi:IS4 family transposase [Deinococcus soli (ex Cha et al. 2016)]|uniref:IS4 family transposase n=1 Tax=Deinococcus soli (ex Cha et al. 2016) TaxID=1309411 RepID=UPI00286CC7CE|nr:IS4 family transposase [Deinococcus soli (ex Cha et al. 2016)]